MNMKQIILKIVLNALAAGFALGGALWYYIRELFVSYDVAPGTLNLYFTVNSNIFLGFSSIIAIVFFVLQLVKGYKVPKWVTVLRFMSTVSVGITFFTVVFFLTPSLAVSPEYGWYGVYFYLYRNSNYFMHVASPIFAMVSFLLLEIDNPLKFKSTILPAIPVSIYTAVYMSLVFITKDMKYDLYGYAHTIDSDEFQIGRAIISLIVMPVLTYGFSCLIWFINKLRYQSVNKIK